MHQLSKLGGCIKTGIELLRSPDISCREHRKVINELDRVGSILGEVTKNSSSELKKLSPIPCLSYAQQRMKTQEEETEQLQNEKEGMPLNIAVQTTRRILNNISNDVKDNKKAEKKNKKNTLFAYNLPPPKGTTYTVEEIIPLMAKIQNNQTRISQFRRLQSDGLVPDVSDTVFRRMLQRFREKTLNLKRPWIKKAGRPALLSADDLKDNFLNKNKINHKSIEDGEIDAAIAAAKKNNYFGKEKTLWMLY